MRTIGVTAGASEPLFAICPRFSMYCSESRSARPSQGLCSISNTTPSNFDALIAIAESVSAGEKAVKAGWPASSARMMPLSRGSSAMQSPWEQPAHEGSARASRHCGYSRYGVRLTSEAENFRV